MCDALGAMVDFELLAGQRYDTVCVTDLIDGWNFDGFIADKAFDAGWIVEEMERRGADIVISQHPKRTAPRAIDEEVYKWRHLVENYIGKLKEFKCIAMRLQDRHQFRRHDPRRSRRHKLQMKLNRP